MKFLLDENLPIWLAADLRKAGLDAVDVREIAQIGLADDAVYQLACSERRHLVSANYKDFGNPLIYPPKKDTGIIIVRMPKCSIKTVASHIARVLTKLDPPDIIGSLLILEPSRLLKKK